MANITGTKGYNSSYRGATAPSAFYEINTTDFGAPAPAAPTLAYESGSGSLGMGTAYVKIAWITAEGVSLPSAEASVVISAGSGAAQVTIPAVPTTGALVIGYQIFSSGTTGTEELNTAGLTTAPVSFTTTSGVVTGTPIATTVNTITTYGTGAAVPLLDHSGIQAAYPSVAADSTVDYYLVVPNSGSQWKTYKSVQYTQPDGVAETAHISRSYKFDCVSPLYPGATPGATTYTQVAVANGTYFVINGTLFIATQLTTVNTAATFIGAAAFQNIAKGSTVTDGSVTWTSLGRAVLVRIRFSNNDASAAHTPTAQQLVLNQE